MKSFFARLTDENRFMQLLVILVLVLLLSPFIEELRIEFPILSLALLATVLFTLFTLKVSRPKLLFFSFFAVLAFCLEIIARKGGIQGNEIFYPAATLVIFIIFFVLAILIILKRLFSASRVTTDTVLGGISLYVLMGFLWAVIYYLVFLFDKNAFHFAERWNDVYLFYFSFTTLTTLGFGDVFPLNKFAMILVNLEAIVGQIYLAVFVARLVGLHIIHQSPGSK